VPSNSRQVSPAILVLEDGRTFSGHAFGAIGETFGEAVFATAMSGYQETLTDPSYARQVVVATAIAIADTEGMDGVSMRRLAVELDLAPMSLYRYVSDKDDLRTKMLDAALAQWKPPERGDAGWRECLEAAGRGL